MFGLDFQMVSVTLHTDNSVILDFKKLRRKKSIDNYIIKTARSISSVKSGLTSFVESSISPTIPPSIVCDGNTP